MANNYLEFSEMIDNLTLEEIKWWKREHDNVISIIDKNDDWQDDGCVCNDFILEEDNRLVWFHCEEGGDVEAIGNVVQKFLKECRPDKCFYLEYATWCSKPRIGEFGGGAIFVTANEVLFHNSNEWVNQREQEWGKNCDVN